MTFVDRLIFVIGFSVMVTLVAIVGAAFVAGEHVSEEIEQARVSHLIGTLRAATEANLSIGLTLDEISPLQSSIEREKANDSGLVAIDVFNGAGRSVYSTDRGAVGEEVEKVWVDNLSREGLWRAVVRGETVFGTRFENDVGVAGGIAVTVSGASRRARAEALGVDLAARAFVVSAGALALGLAAAFAFAFARGRPFTRVSRILLGADVRPAPQQRLERLAVQVRETWSASDARITRGVSQLEALDDAD